MKLWAQRILGGLVLLVIAFGLTACGNSDQAQVVDQFMRAVADRKGEAAYALFSSQAKETVAEEDFLTNVAGASGDYLQGYQDLSVTNLNVSTDADGTYAEISGKVNFEDGRSLAFEALLNKEGEAWLITSVDIE